MFSCILVLEVMMLFRCFYFILNHRYSAESLFCAFSSSLDLLPFPRRRIRGKSCLEAALPAVRPTFVYSLHISSPKQFQFVARGRKKKCSLFYLLSVLTLGETSLVFIFFYTTMSIKTFSHVFHILSFVPGSVNRIRVYFKTFYDLFTIFLY